MAATLVDTMNGVDTLAAFADEQTSMQATGYQPVWLTSWLKEIDMRNHRPSWKPQHQLKEYSHEEFMAQQTPERQLALNGDTVWISSAEAKLALQKAQDRYEHDSAMSKRLYATTGTVVEHSMEEFHRDQLIQAERARAEARQSQLEAEQAQKLAKPSNKFQEALEQFHLTFTAAVIIQRYWREHKRLPEPETYHEINRREFLATMRRKANEFMYWSAALHSDGTHAYADGKMMDQKVMDDWRRRRLRQVLFRPRFDSFVNVVQTLLYYLRNGIAIRWEEDTANGCPLTSMMSDAGALQPGTCNTAVPVFDNTASATPAAVHLHDTSQPAATVTARLPMSIHLLDSVSAPTVASRSSISAASSTCSRHSSYSSKELLLMLEGELQPRSRGASRTSSGISVSTPSYGKTTSASQCGQSCASQAVTPRSPHAFAVLIKGDSAQSPAHALSRFARSNNPFQQSRLHEDAQEAHLDAYHGNKDGQPATNCQSPNGITIQTPDLDIPTATDKQSIEHEALPALGTGISSGPAMGQVAEAGRMTGAMVAPSALPSHIVETAVAGEHSQGATTPVIHMVAAAALTSAANAGGTASTGSPGRCSATGNVGSCILATAAEADATDVFSATVNDFSTLSSCLTHATDPHPFQAASIGIEVESQRYRATFPDATAATTTGITVAAPAIGYGTGSPTVPSATIESTTAGSVPAASISERPSTAVRMKRPSTAILDAPSSTASSQLAPVVIPHHTAGRKAAHSPTAVSTMNNSSASSPGASGSTSQHSSKSQAGSCAPSAGSAAQLPVTQPELLQPANHRLQPLKPAPPAALPTLTKSPSRNRHASTVVAATNSSNHNNNDVAVPATAMPKISVRTSNRAQNAEMCSKAYTAPFWERGLQQELVQGEPQAGDGDDSPLMFLKIDDSVDNDPPQVMELVLTCTAGLAPIMIDSPTPSLMSPQTASHPMMPSSSQPAATVPTRIPRVPASQLGADDLAVVTAQKHQMPYKPQLAKLPTFTEGTSLHASGRRSITVQDASSSFELVVTNKPTHLHSGNFSVQSTVPGPAPGLNLPAVASQGRRITSDGSTPNNLTSTRISMNGSLPPTKPRLSNNGNYSNGLPTPPARVSANGSNNTGNCLAPLDAPSSRISANGSMPAAVSAVNTVNGRAGASLPVLPQSISQSNSTLLLPDLSVLRIGPGSNFAAGSRR